MDSPISRLVAWWQFRQAMPRQCEVCRDILTVGQGDRVCSDECAEQWNDARAL